MASYMTLKKEPSASHMERTPYAKQIDHRAQMIVDDEKLWKELQRELKNSNAVTRFSTVEITGKFMEKHFQAATEQAVRRCSLEMVKRLPASALQHYNEKQRAPKNQTFRDLCDVGNVKDFDAPDTRALTLQSMMMDQPSKPTNHKHHVPAPPRVVQKSLSFARPASIRRISTDSSSSIHSSRSSLLGALAQAASLAEELCASLADEDLDFLSTPPPPPPPLAAKDYSPKSVVLRDFEKPRRVLRDLEKPKRIVALSA